MIPLSASTVTQSNLLIESCYTLATPAKRLIFLMMSRVNPLRSEEAQGDAWRNTVTVDEWIYAFGGTKKTARARLVEALESLTNAKPVFIKDQNGKLKHGCNWTGDNEFMSDHVVVRLSPTLRKLFCGELMTAFTTTTPLISYAKLRNIHSMKLYECVCKFRSTGVYRTSVDDFRVTIGAYHLENKAPDSRGRGGAKKFDIKYPRFGELKRNVITPAIADIKKNLGIDVSFKIVKRDGPKIVTIEFKFKKCHKLNIL